MPKPDVLQKVKQAEPIEEGTASLVLLECGHYLRSEYKVKQVEGMSFVCDDCLDERLSDFKIER